MVREDALPEGFPDGGIPGPESGQGQREEADGRGHRFPEAVREAQADRGRTGSGHPVQEPPPGHGADWSSHRLARSGGTSGRYGNEVRWGLYGDGYGYAQDAPEASPVPSGGVSRGVAARGVGG